MSLSVASAYGLSYSINFDWPWCRSYRLLQAPDLQIVLGDVDQFNARERSDYEPYASRPAQNAADPPVVRVDRARAGGSYRIAYSDGAEFIVEQAPWQVFGIARSALTLDDLLVYLQGPILGFVLRLRGVTCLHASAVVVGDRAIAIVGQGGAGKSTTAAAFARLGFPVLTDDVLALRDDDVSFQVQPGLPRVLLWPPSAAALFGSAKALPRIVGTWNKRYLDLTQPGYHFASEPAPLAAIYVLGERVDDVVLPPQIEGTAGTEALVTLVANTYANDFLDSRMRAQEFDVLSRVVRSVPIRRVRAPNDRGSVTRVCEAIIEDFTHIEGVGLRTP